MTGIYEIDELKLYRGEDFIISNYIKIRQPTLLEVCEYGEQDYYSMIHLLTATPQSMKAQLWDMGIDYTEITPYELFYNMLVNMFPQEKTSIIFGDLDLTSFQPMKRTDNGDIVLYQEIEESVGLVNKKRSSIFKRVMNKLLKKSTSNPLPKKIEEILIDEYTYTVIVDHLRKTYLIEKDEKVPANESTKLVLIEDAQIELRNNKNKEYKSHLKNLVSTMVNSEGFKYNHITVWDMKINAFMDSVRRISKIKNSDLLLQSGYSGYGIDLKGIDKKQLDWLGELD